MKKLILILVLAFTAQVSFSQTKIDFFDFVRNFDWSISESDFQSKYKNYILPGTDSIPDFHATTGAWLLKDIYMGDYENRIVVDYNEQSNVSTIVLITDTIRDLDYAQIERVVGDELGEPTFADGDVELLVLGLQQTSAKLWIKKKQIFCSMALGEDDSKVFMLTIMKREPDFRKNYWGDSLEKEYLNSREVYGYSYYVKKYLKDADVLERYSDDFARTNSRITDILNDIRNNKKVTTPKGTFNIKNALIKADLVTLNINYNDIFNKLDDNIYTDLYDYIDGLATNLDKLFKLMREYCKEDIIFISFSKGYENISEDGLDVLEYLTNKYKSVCRDYDIIYLDISDISIQSGADLEKIGNRVIKIANTKLFEA